MNDDVLKELTIAKEKLEQISKIISEVQLYPDCYKAIVKIKEIIK